MNQVPEFWRPATAVRRTQCGVLLGFVEGQHCRCIRPLGHDGVHADRSDRWWT